MFRFETLDFIYVWDLPGSERIRDLDFPLTYGDGLTLHPAEKVAEVLMCFGECECELVSAIRSIQKEKGNFLLAF